MSEFYLNLTKLKRNYEIHFNLICFAKFTISCEFAPLHEKFWYHMFSRKKNGRIIYIVLGPLGPLGLCSVMSLSEETFKC